MKKNKQQKRLKSILNINLIFTLISLTFFPSYIKAETVLEEIDRTGLLKVGIRNDAIPFGYRVDGELKGICVDIIAKIREELTKKIDRDIISIELVISTLDNRFDLVAEQIVHFECGPNTIRNLENYSVTFSEPFFLSGIKFMVAKDQAKNLINSQGKDFKIGLLKNTTSETFIREKYPEAQFQIFQGIRGNERGLQAVRQGRIDAFANDGILLIGQSLVQGLSFGENSNFILAPDPPFTCERYGLILPADDIDWQNFINSSLNLEEKMKMINNWFNVILLTEMAQNTIEQCGNLEIKN